MSYKWDNMTKEAWQNSEVMQEFEKNLLETVAKFEKWADRRQQAEELSNILTDVHQKSTEADKAVTSLLGNSAVDLDSALELEEELLGEELEEAPDDLPLEELPEDLPEGVLEDISVDEEDFEEEDVELAKQRLLDDLREMAAEAAYSGNIKLAYKIERAMDEIREEL